MYPIIVEPSVEADLVIKMLVQASEIEADRRMKMNMDDIIRCFFIDLPFYIKISKRHYNRK